MSRELSGYKAKQSGDAFEAIFHAMCNRFSIGCISIPDGCFRVKTPYGVKLKPCTTPFDYLICKDGRAAAIDCKTLNEDVFAYSCVVRHQLDSLTQSGQHIPSGYVVWFRPSGQIVFYDHHVLSQVQPRTSLKQTDGQIIGRIGYFEPERILNHVTKSTIQQNLF